ncbi:hypothetical protein SYNPS1DRAFT_23595, partial [Syncephalis pseudoplumigaleata]
MPGAAKAATATATSHASTTGAFHSKYYMPLPGEVMDVVQRLKIPHRPGTTSLEMAVRCPSCIKASAHKPRWPEQPFSSTYTARLDKLSGAFNCHSCGTAETWVGFLHMVGAPEVMGDQHHQRVGTPLGAIGTDAAGDGQQQQQQLPRIDAAAFARSLPDHPDVLAWASGTEAGQMHIQPQVLRDYGVGVGHLDTQGQPSPPSPPPPSSEQAAHDADADAEAEEPTPLYVTFPRVGVRPDAGKTDAAPSLVVTRVRAIDWSNHERVLYDPMYNTLPGLFGYQLAFTAKESTVVVTPREFDAMAVYQATNVPAISLPDGQYQLPLN